MTDHERDVLRKLLGGFTDAIILEAGAYDLENTAFFLDCLTSPPRIVISLEPDMRNIARMGRCVVPECVKVICAALSDKEGTAMLHLSEDDNPHSTWSLSSTLKTPSNHRKWFPEIRFEREVEVPTVTVDSLAREYDLSRIDLLFLDIEGSERDALRGAAEMLPRTRYIYTEFWTKPAYDGMALKDDLLAMLPGWEVVETFTSDMLLRNIRYVEPAKH